MLAMKNFYLNNLNKSENVSISKAKFNVRYQNKLLQVFKYIREHYIHHISL